ncbi:MAG: 2,3-bisphosphoglycerate-independent phosphoglycerate mutase [Candidatus Omnitrophica bacterium]|nr:2,3-bisphosphoglycerate-independent phosphoglycerate mutase [Candidatus Omnitrophota bacterium]MCM8807726.1 2,3-bisphosphoglycerate-independent phosphoglycerate mutase [Candidatus Omnitrophota bacterium]
MEYEKILPEIIQENDKKILLVVLDGIGGLPHPITGKTELETARIPNLDYFAKIGSCGLIIPVLPGITPGSGPGHIALFGYDPIEIQIGRGILECLGIGLEVKKGEIAIRGNFATIDENKIVTDRRAGRIPTEENEKIVNLISENIREIKGIKIKIKTVKEHRCAIILSGENLSIDVSENDPGKEGKPLKNFVPLSEKGKFTAEVLNEFEERVINLLKNVDTKAKCILLRGFSTYPEIKTFKEKYKLNACCIATYPMYKGISKLVGMDVIDCGETVEEEIMALQKVYNDYNFFFLHIKKTDSLGEDGNFEGKVKFIEEIDKKIELIKSMEFEAIAITGDHSTPSKLKGHSWHPVPFVLVSPNTIPDDVQRFTEKECSKGILGNMYSKNVMYLLLACSLKLGKFGA